MKKNSLILLLLCMVFVLILPSCTFMSQLPIDSSFESQESVLPNDSSDFSQDSSFTENPDQPIEPEKPLRVLFLGNSLMFFNDMPSLFKNLAEKAGKEVYVDSVTRGSATISDFADSSTDVGSLTYPKLMQQRWDYVVIEPSRRITPYENTVYEAELSAAKRIQKLAKQAGGDVMLYCVWGNNDGTLTEYNATNPIAMIKGAVHYDYTRKMHVEFLRSVSTRFAQELGGVGIIDAGYAFENSIATYPNINLYDSDQRHPSLEGSYLAASCAFAKIYNQNPENIGFTGGTPLYFEMQRMAKITVIDGIIPDLEEKPEEIIQEDDPYAYNVLVVGSGLMNDYDIETSLNDMIRKTENLGLELDYVVESTGVWNRLATESSDFGLRNALKRVKYDAVILQISRRCTPSALDVAQSELNALNKIYPLISENCDNIYLLTLNGQSNQAIYTTEGDALSYTKTGKYESAGVSKMNEYYKSLASDWAEEVNCKVINQGYAWTASDPSTNEEKGFVRACAIYNSIFKKEVPNNLDTNGLDADVVEYIKNAVAFHCLPAPEPQPLPEYETYDVLVIGSKYMENYSPENVLADMVEKGQNKELYLKYVTDSVGVFGQLVSGDLSDNYYTQAVDALGERKWDAIVLQLSRRITPSSMVESAEYQALQKLYPELIKNTSNLYLFTLVGSENPDIFTTVGNAIKYTKSGYKIMATVSEMNAYFDSLVNQWSGDIFKPIYQGSMFTSLNLSNDSEKGYMRACYYYNAFFGEKVPQNASLNGLDESIAKEVRKAVQNKCLGFIPADLTQLNQLLQNANVKVESDYTPNSWIAFSTALQTAKSMTQENEQEEINSAVIALENALNALVNRADFTALQTAILLAESKSKANYTTTTWLALEGALLTAKNIDFNAEQSVVDSAVIALNNAIDALIVKADLTDLNNAIQTANSLDGSLYTAESWQNLENALAYALTINEESSAQQVVNATVALNDAITALELKANFDELNALISEIFEMDENGYTIESWAFLEVAISLKDGLTQESSQSEVDAVISQIKDAKNKLVLIPTYETYDVLFIGSDLINDEYIEVSLSSMIELGQGKQLHLEYVTDGVGIFNRLVAREDETDNGDVYTRMRNALNERRWDAIILQLSRRCTPGSEVETSEFNALKAVYPLLVRNTSNIFLFTLNGSANPDVFKNSGVSYEKTGKTYTATAAEISEYYKTTVESWATALNCKTILYGSAYAEFAPSTSKPKGFMRALCIYYSIFGEEMPDGTNVQGTSSSGVKKIKTACAKYCL